MILRGPRGPEGLEIGAVFYGAFVGDPQRRPYRVAADFQEFLAGLKAFE